MESKKKCCHGGQQNDKNVEQASQEFPGVAVNQGDCGKTDPRLVKERTRTLNNNPRNDD